MDSTNSFLSFLIDNEYFAVNVENVLEVLLKPRISRIPNVPSEIKGVTNFRGEIIPVFETRICFGMPDKEKLDKYVILVLEVIINGNKTNVGAIADKVKEVFEVDNQLIQAIPEMTTKARKEMITGIYKTKNDFVILIDANKIFVWEDNH